MCTLFVISISLDFFGNVTFFADFLSFLQPTFDTINSFIYHLCFTP